MSIANSLALPNPLSNGTTADAVAVMADFNYLLSALNRALLDAGSGAGMNAQLTQIHNLANGTSANDAVNLSQISGLAALSGATFTGALAGTTLALSSTLSVTGGAGITGGLSLGSSLALNTNNTTLQFTDASGTHPFFTVDGSNLFSFYGTDGSGAARSIMSIAMRSGTSALTLNPNVSLQNGLTVAGTLTLNGGTVPNVQSVASAATVTPSFVNDLVDITALATSVTLANPSGGTASNGVGTVIRIKDNGTPRTIAYGTQYTAIGVTLPTTTVAGKALLLGMIYNANLTRWEVVSVAQE